MFVKVRVGESTAAPGVLDWAVFVCCSSVVICLVVCLNDRFAARYCREESRQAHQVHQGHGRRQGNTMRARV